MIHNEGNETSSGVLQQHRSRSGQRGIDSGRRGDRDAVHARHQGEAGEPVRRDRRADLEPR